MSLFFEYTQKITHSGWGIPELKTELSRLIGEYNKIQKSYLFVYSAARNKPIPHVPLEQNDYYMICDFLRHKKDIKNLDFYIETPGGDGETAEEIGKFLRKNFETLRFVVSGEAKSAGTILVMSGDYILMTDTGSLGPIDAQINLGRSRISAYDYLQWIDEKRKEALEYNELNPVDAIVIAQINPGELKGIFHSFKFAEDIVTEWLFKYKFKKWTYSKSRKQEVTDELRKSQANKIAQALSDHGRWRTHGRSLKIEDLRNIELKINRLDDTPEIAELVYRIQVICTLIFNSSPAYKIMATEESGAFITATKVDNVKALPQVKEVFEINAKCEKCGKEYKTYLKLEEDKNIDEELKKEGFKKFPKNGKIKCECKFEIDLMGIKSDIELQTGKKVIP